MNSYELLEQHFLYVMSTSSSLNTFFINWYQNDTQDSQAWKGGGGETSVMPSEVFQIQILLEYLSNHWLLNIARRPEGRVANTHSQSKFLITLNKNRLTKIRFGFHGFCLSVFLGGGGWVWRSCLLFGWLGFIQLKATNALLNFPHSTRRQ